jgi:hypothetical protein
MNSKDTEDLLARRLAGEDVARGKARVSHEPIQPTGHPDGDMGLARDAETGADPVVELHHHLDAATRALHALEGQRDAA